MALNGTPSASFLCGLFFYEQKCHSSFSSFVHSHGFTGFLALPLPLVMPRWYSYSLASCLPSAMLGLLFCCQVKGLFELWAFLVRADRALTLFFSRKLVWQFFHKVLQMLHYGILVLGCRDSRHASLQPADLLWPSPHTGWILPLASPLLCCKKLLWTASPQSHCLCRPCGILCKRIS